MAPSSSIVVPRFAVSQLLGIELPSTPQECSLSPFEIRKKLIMAGVLPSAEAAKTAFWASGNWWRPLIDGCQHPHGPLVFDQGLHGGYKEPGYLHGLEQGCRVFLEALDQELSLETYRKTHFAACKHFGTNPQDDGTRCSGSEIDEFRVVVGKTTVPAAGIGVQSMKSMNWKLPLLWNDLDSFSRKTAKGKPVDAQELEKTIRSAQEELGEACVEKDLSVLGSLIKLKSEGKQKEIDDTVHEVTGKLRAEFQRASESLGLDRPFVECWSERDGDLLYEYRGETWASASHAGKPSTQMKTELVISVFNEILRELQKSAYSKLESKDAAEIKREYLAAVIPLIQWIYSMKEWIHPWIDGQGRTDLIELNGLLCREGAHPGILEEPYFSTCHTIEESVAYLYEGLAVYKKFIAGLEGEQG